MKNWLCPDLSHSLYIERDRNGDPRIAFCCNALPQTPTKAISITDPILERERAQSVDQLPPSCIRCTRAEQTGTNSRRISTIDFYRANGISVESTPSLKNLDFNCQTVCNLKCIMCNSDYSSSWHEDEVALGISSGQPAKQKNRNLAAEIDVGALRRVHFNGGEPLMSNDHITLMERIVAAGQAGVCQLSYNTNGTLRPSDRVLELWQNFELVKVYFSIDAVGEQFEYIRYPAKWDQVEANIQWWRTLQTPCPILEFNVAVGVQNILYIEELTQWVESAAPANAQGDPTNISVQPVTHPSLGIENLPEKFHQKALDTLDKISYYNWSEGLRQHVLNAEQPNTKWQTWLADLDRIRGTDWQSSLGKLNQ